MSPPVVPYNPFGVGRQEQVQ